MVKHDYQEAHRLLDIVEDEFGVSKGDALVLLADLLADVIMSTEVAILYQTFGRNQSNRLSLRKLNSALRVLKKENLYKFEG